MGLGSKFRSGGRLAAAALAAAGMAGPREASAFCGFYVAKADAALYNEASQVVLVRDGNRTVISMMNDYKGDLKEFALVVPVPVVLKKGQVHVGDKKLFERVDGFSAPRLVEYFDEDPCEEAAYMSKRSAMMELSAAGAAPGAARTKSLGVTVEAEFAVGEYDIVILSAKESDGLETWLIEGGYSIPKGASRALRPYIQQKMKFFVAKVNLSEAAKTGLNYLRPLQFAFESERFMLPIRLGMINAKGPQDLLIFAITRNGRVEATNYRTVQLPTGMDLPVYVKGEFPAFYKAMFDRQAKHEEMRAVFTEHAWDMAWCDPCAADPLTPQELKGLGVFWVGADGSGQGPGILPMPRRRPFPRGGGGPVQAFVTRLHVRYSPETFPEDLVFQETGDRGNYQGRYVLRHPWKGEASKCEAAKAYHQGLKERREGEAKNLADLTGWKLEEIRRKMELGSKPRDWWEELWQE